MVWGLLFFGGLVGLALTLVFWPASPRARSAIPGVRDWEAFDARPASRLGEAAAWCWLDPLLSSRRGWRRWRGGVWERWHMERGAPMWFGPRRRSTHSLVRELANDGYSPVVAAALARPSLACRETPQLEDWRPATQHSGEWSITPGVLR